MAPSRAPSERAAAKAAAEKITAACGGRVQVAPGTKMPPMKTPSTKTKAKVANKTGVKKPTTEGSKNQTKTAGKGSDKQDSSSPLSRFQPPSKEEAEQTWKDFQKIMGLVMWRFERSQELMESGSRYGQWIKAELRDKYHAENNPKGVEVNGGFLLYRNPPDHSPDGSAYAVLEPVTRTWKYYDPPAYAGYLGPSFGFPAGFSREHPNFNVLPVWRYNWPDETSNMGSVVFRVEHKISKHCRLVDVHEAEKTKAQNFHYPKGFVKAGEEGDFSYHGRSYSRFRE